MKYYTPTRYTGKAKQKRAFRIALICLLVFGILSGLAVLGNLLGDRLQRAQSLLSLTPDDYTAKAEAPVSYVYDKSPEKRQLAFTGASVPITTKEMPIEAVLTDIAAGGGLSFTVSDEHGRRFAIGADEANTQRLPLSFLSDTAKLAEENGLHTSATVYPSYSAQTDAETLKALADCGVTEVVLCGLTGESLDEADTYTLLLYLERLRGLSPQTTVGLALSPSLFRDPLSARHLDTLCDYYDFLLLDLRAVTSVEQISQTVTALYGSISYYSLAVLLDSTCTESTVLTALAESGVQTVRYFER